MSKFSGKCDLYDHIYCSADPDKTEIDLFEKFKQKTGGVIYQTLKINLTKHSVCKEAETNEFLEIIEPTQKGGRKKYRYFWKDFSSLKSLNNYGYYKEVAIHFDTMLDLVEYYPYLVHLATSVNGKSKITIGNESFVDSEYKELLGYGYESQMREVYKRELKKEYYRVGKLYDKTLGFDSPEDAKLWYIMNYGIEEK